METHDNYTVRWNCALPTEQAAAAAMLDDISSSLLTEQAKYKVVDFPIFIKFYIQYTKSGLLGDSYRLLDSDSFERWLDDSQTGLLWLRDLPGTGKMPLVRRFIERSKVSREADFLASIHSA